MTFFFDGGKVLRCKACGFRMYLGPWDLIHGWWPMPANGGSWKPPHRPCIPCGGQMVETHVGRADGWVEIVGAAV